MNPAESATSPLRELLEKMVATRQLSPGDAQALARQAASGGGDAPVRSEEDVLRWLAKEHDLAFTALDDVGAGQGSNFPVPGPRAAQNERCRCGGSTARWKWRKQTLRGPGASIPCGP